MMEVARKIKKSKKRRHRSKDIKKEESLETIKNICQENNKAILNLRLKNINERKILKSNQLVQTDISNHDLESKELSSEKDEQIKALTERIQQVTSKLYESKNAYTSLKQDFNKAQKLLCSEVGENVTVSSLSNQPGGWRGRADQIRQLQQKVTELQSRLSDGDGSRRKSLERRSSSSVRIFDKERKQQIENLTKELRDTEATLEGTKKKFDAAKARIAVLENELNTSKRTVSLLNEKTSHDNQLIEALHNKIKLAETKYQDREIVIKRQNDKYEREIVLLKSEVEAAEIHLKNFKRQIDDKNKEVECLRSRDGMNMERTVLQPLQTNTLRQSPQPSPRRCSKEVNEYIAISIAAEAERERLLELVAVLNQRLDKEKHEIELLSESFKRERIRSARLETKLQKMELERAGLSKVNTGSYKLRAPKPTMLSNNDLGDPEEIRLKFELLQEECLTLKTRLATLQKDKASDLAAFKNMLEQTRKIFQDAYKGKISAFGGHSTVTV